MVHQGCVKGAIYPIVQRVVEPKKPKRDVSRHRDVRPNKGKMPKWKPVYGRICKVCASPVPPDRPPAAETCCDECSKILQRKASRECMRAARAEAKAARAEKPCRATS